MDTPQFTERMALVRTRFAERISGRLEATDAVLPILASDDRQAIAGVAEVYRRFHDMCGVGPIIGFNETGEAARTLVDVVLTEPFRNGRPLTSDELKLLKEGLDAFRDAVRTDMQTIFGTGDVSASSTAKPMQ